MAEHLAPRQLREDLQRLNRHEREAFRLSREERDHIAGHALDSIYNLSAELNIYVSKAKDEDASTSARKIAALSNLLGDIGWEREAVFPNSEDPQLDVAEGEASWILGELFPIAQLRPWLEEWQRQDNEALTEAEQAFEVCQLEKIADPDPREGAQRQIIANAQTKLGSGAILLARIEKWMASRGN
jgi:hypothetical protein